MQELGYLGHILNPLAEGRERSNEPPACVAAYEQRRDKIGNPLATLRTFTMLQIKQFGEADAFPNDGHQTLRVLWAVGNVSCAKLINLDKFWFLNATCMIKDMITHGDEAPINLTVMPHSRRDKEEVVVHPDHTEDIRIEASSVVYDDWREENPSKRSVALGPGEIYGLYIDLAIAVGEELSSGKILTVYE